MGLRHFVTGLSRRPHATDMLVSAHNSHVHAARTGQRSRLATTVIKEVQEPY